ncbi:fibrinogen C domain-containing protein 1 [Parasteatoda tepidariorum]|nr:fibrinogen C domain-containing protein 1 [Parasteatoda tepidariorum]
MSIIYVSTILFLSLVPCARTGHQDLRKELAAVKELVITVERKLNSLSLPDIGKKLNSFETSINTLVHKVTDINRKSQLLSEIHQDNDARKEVLQRMSRSLEDINRKQLTFLEKKNEVEIDRLDKLSENVQALFQIFGGMNRKIDDLQTRVERISNVCPTSDLKFFITKKIDSLTASMAMLSECLECDRDSLKDVLQSFLRQPMDNIVKKCASGDVERNLGRMIDSKLKGMSDTLQSSVQTKLQSFNVQLHGAIEECSCKNQKLTAHDIAYSSDTHQEQRTVGKSEESPGRIFRKLWRKMIEPINKVGEKIESLSQTIEVSNERHHNSTLSKLKEWTGKTKDGGEACSKQILGVQNETKKFAEKLEQIETRQISVQSTTNKILSEMERVRSNIKGSNTVFVPGVTEAYIEGPGADGYVGTNCADIQMQGITRNGIYTLKPKGATDQFIAYCDLETDGGGWTTGTGFNLEGLVYTMSMKDTVCLEYELPPPQSLRPSAAMETRIANISYLKIPATDTVSLQILQILLFKVVNKIFRVEEENKQYRLYVSGYQGNATDSLSLHDNKMFSTYDRDNDEVASCCNCADTFKGGWWYYRCFEANLNGPYHTDPTENGYFLGIIWERWKGDYSLKSSEMKIRPLNFEDLRDP